jgi:hypothetical protein
MLTGGPLGGAHEVKSHFDEASRILALSKVIQAGRER